MALDLDELEDLCRRSQSEESEDFSHNLAAEYEQKLFDAAPELIAAARELAKRDAMEVCSHCGSSNIYHGPPDCSGCGAPGCCKVCCNEARLEARAKKAEAERDRLRDKVISIGRFISEEFIGSDADCEGKGVIVCHHCDAAIEDNESDLDSHGWHMEHCSVAQALKDGE